MTLLHAALVGVGVTALVAGCSGASDKLATASGTEPPLKEEAADVPQAGSVNSYADGGARAYAGSPLCGLPTTCDPDKGAASACTRDGGVAACRVQAGARAECEASGKGGDGVACRVGSDCLPGYDCVGGTTRPASGTAEPGVCRRYCCAGDCSMAHAANGGATFCDFADHLPASYLVPACVPVKPCDLLKHGSCQPGETCSVVSDDGARSCVAIGKAGVGASCDLERCQTDLTCRGKPGKRVCLQLCKLTGANTCTVGRCQSFGSKIQDNTIGFCQ